MMKPYKTPVPKQANKFIQPIKILVFGLAILNVISIIVVGMVILFTNEVYTLTEKLIAVEAESVIAGSETIVLPTVASINVIDEKKSLPPLPKQNLSAESDLNQATVQVENVDQIETQIEAGLELLPPPVANTVEKPQISKPRMKAVPAPKISRSLSIPALDVSATLLDIPLVDNGWDVSGLHEEVGHLEGFPNNPTNDGAMVLAGHATVRWPQPGPFKHLNRLNLGDRIIYQLGQTEYVYSVQRLLFVETDNVEVLQKGGEDGIVLVTCGSYNFFTGIYNKRLVVYGQLDEIRESPAHADENSSSNKSLKKLNK